MSAIDPNICEEIFSRVNDYLDRELTPREMQEVREHLEICALCASEFAFATSYLREMKSKLRHVALPSDLMTKISGLLADTEQAEGS